MPSTPAALRIAVIIASVGRPVELGRWIDHMRRQTVQPDALILSVSQPSDAPDAATLAGAATVVYSAPGLPIQRNTGLAAAMATNDIIAFFDDDYVPSIRCIEGIAAFFQGHPDVVGINGTLLADGINSAGISYEDALAMVEAHDRAPASPPGKPYGIEALYGCNMVYRTRAIGEERFDEALPLYAWQEDFDFAARVARRGRLLVTTAFHGVHQGVKGGRLRGVRLGYSQIANPVYLVRKGAMSAFYAGHMMLKNVAMNLVKAPSPEPWIDRLARAKGNWIAIKDVLTGRDHPSRILELDR